MGRMGSTTSVRARQMRRVLAGWQRSGLTLRSRGETRNPAEHAELVASGLAARRRGGGNGAAAENRWYSPKCPNR